jgi:lauroyl/myristoyl acyltransferase
MRTPEAVPTSASAASPQPRATLPLFTANDLLWLVYFYPICWLARILPRSFLYAIGKLVDPIVQLHLHDRKEKAVPWIAEACGVTAGRAREIARRSLTNNLFGTLDDLLLLRPSPEGMLCCQGVEGRHHLESAIARGKGVILLVGHFFASRIALRYLAKNGYETLSVRNRQPSNAAEGRLGRRFVRARRSEVQQRVLPDHVYVQDPECTLKIMRRLRAGGLAAVQLDGRAGTNPLEYSFLGMRRHLASGTFEIVRLSGCAVVPMLCLGRSDGFRIRFEPALEIVPATSRDAFVCANLPRFVTVMERQIIANPEEWRLWNPYLAWRV